MYELKSHLCYPHFRFALQAALHTESFPLHTHDFSELMLVLGGNAIHHVGERTYRLKQGDIFVIKGSVAHGFSEVENLRMYNLMFDHQHAVFDSIHLRQLPGYQALFHIDPIAREQLDYAAKLNLSGVDFEQVLQQIQTIEAEYQQGQVGMETMLRAQLQQLAIMLSRLHQGEIAMRHPSTLALSRAFVFIEQAFSITDISSQDIAQAASVSTRQLERIFRHYLHISPNRYLHNKRLDSAKHLLLSDRYKNIAEISSSCGFSDSNYFSRMFKKATGLTPTMYRKIS